MLLVKIFQMTRQGYTAKYRVYNLHEFHDYIYDRD